MTDRPMAAPSTLRDFLRTVGVATGLVATAGRPASQGSPDAAELPPNALGEAGCERHGASLGTCGTCPIVERGPRREPTAGDIERCGNPVLVDWTADPPKISYDAKSMTQMMATLAVVPPSTIRQMHPRDWETIALRLCPFFLPDLLMS